MQMPFLDPMFDNRQSVLGLPAGVLIVVLALALCVAGFIVIRRIAAGEGEIRSFRATDHRDATGVLTRAVAAAGITFALVLALLVLAR